MMQGLYSTEFLNMDAFLWYAADMRTSISTDLNFREIYSGFSAPIAHVDCGQYCAPYNELGVPFCCDIRHAVPTAYLAEWNYLRSSTDLWNIWHPDDEELANELTQQTPSGQVLIACQGHEHCQRDFRSMTCRAFPFFPYITRQGKFIGLAYYWQYEDRCWVISHLDTVQPEFLKEFTAVYDGILSNMPEERDAFRSFSITMRRVFGRKHRAITLLHRNGNLYKISPGSGRMRKTAALRLAKYGPYQIAQALPFPDEMDEISSTVTFPKQ